MLTNLYIPEILTTVVVMSIGALLVEKKILRARQLIYVYFPLAFTFIMLLTAVWNRRFSTWLAELLFSIVAAAILTGLIIVMCRIRGIDFDQLDQKGGWFSRRKRHKRNRREKDK